MRLLIITTDGLNDTQRAQIQRIVEDSADDWWHRQTNTWIVVTSEKPAEWRDKFAAIIHEPPGSVLVMAIDPIGWAGRSAGGIGLLGNDWLRENITRAHGDGETA